MTQRNQVLDTIRNRYNEFSATYVPTWSKLEGYSDFVREFLARKATPGASVLDVGCGPGHLTGDLPDSVNVVGLDIAPKMIEEAARVRPLGRYLVHNYYEPFPSPGPFDVIISVGALDFCEDLDKVLSNIAAVSRPGTSLLLMLIERRAGHRGHEARRLPITPERMPGVDLIMYSLQEMVAAFERAGLEGQRYYHHKGYHNQYHDLDIEYAIWELTR